MVVVGRGMEGRGVVEWKWVFVVMDMDRFEALWEYRMTEGYM